jgi:hypothetical protein
MFTGVAPMLVVCLFRLALYGEDIEATFAGNAPKWIALAAIPAFVWAVVILVQIVGKRDPLCDKIAGTAVVRVGPAAVPNTPA